MSVVQPIRASQARFYLADFHVHSPGSHDFRDDSDQPLSVPERAKEHDREAITRHPVSAFLDRVVQRRDEVYKLTCPYGDDPSAIVAITDHNVCEYACALARHASAPDVLPRTQLLVLPGIELDVTFPDGNNDVNAHLLLCFPTESEHHHIYQAITTAATATYQGATPTQWEFGQPTLRVTSLPDFVHALRRSGERPAIVIAAHINSTHGVHKETRKSILSRLEAELASCANALLSATGDEHARLTAEHDAL